MSLSSVDRGYLTKKTPAEYAASEDVVEELRMRFVRLRRLSCLSTLCCASVL